MLNNLAMANHSEEYNGESGLAFDGIICFGGVDWWYHNRGHYDLQMMRELSKRVPVLYINSIGMRPPLLSEGRMFWVRVKRKLKSVRRGLVEVRENFYVFSPLALPGGGRSTICKWLGKRFLVAQVQQTARGLGITTPLVWVACPPAAPVVPTLKPARVVYQRTDRTEAFGGVDPDWVRVIDQQLKRMSDLVLYCSRALMAEEEMRCCHALFVDHGVDYDRFSEAGEAARKTGAEPDELKTVSHPRAGFIGGIDVHTFDPPFFLNVARRLPDIQFVLVGACSLPDGWCDLPNVRLLGQRPYEQVAQYMAACDVLIMPWNQGEWIKACNPVKLKEYLATGRPIVSTWFAEIEHYRDHVSIAREPETFAAAIRAAVADPGDAEARRAFVRDHTWTRKAETVWNAVAQPENGAHAGL
jgi:glycosyltransferase involved in cell wall biosynthesis